MNMKLKTILAHIVGDASKRCGVVTLGSVTHYLVTLLVAMLGSSGAWAQSDPVAVTSETTTFEDGNVYEVTADVSVSSRITVNGTVTLVLGEGTTLTATRGITVGTDNQLTIQGPGALTADSFNSSSGIGGLEKGDCGTIIINSGTITAQGYGTGAGIGGGGYGGSCGTVIINGGIVTATGNQTGAGIGGGGASSSNTPGAGGTITINGGQVTATSPTGYGIGCGKNANGGEGTAATIALGWTADTDFIAANSIGGTVTLNSDFHYYGGGSVTVSNIADNQGKWLMPSAFVNPLSGLGTQDSHILLEDVDDWNEFAKVEHASSYWGSDVYVKMSADIGTTDAPVTTMIGTSDKPFCGHFDGSGKTLTVNLTESASYVAPFSCISGATIHDLTVAGSVTGRSDYRGGLVGYANGGTNTISGVTVTASIGSMHYAGGIVGYASNNTMLTLNGCVFGGYFDIGKFNYAAGLVGYCGSCTLNISNCLSKGSYNVNGNRVTFFPIARKEYYATVTTNVSECYYTVAPTDATSSYYVAAGTQVYTTAPDGVVYRTVRAADGEDYYGPVAVSGVADTYSYTGSPIDFSYTVTDPDGVTALSKGTHFTATVAIDGTHVETVGTKGIYTLTLTGTGDYSGTQVVHFTVRRDMLLGSGTEADPYLIEDAADWSTFCDEANRATLWASGAYVKMTADVGTDAYPVTTTTGTNYRFYGNFDGDGHTLTVGYGTAEAPLTKDCIAPFGYIEDASIKYLHTAGHIYTSANHAAGLAGYAYATNTIRNCRPSVVITSAKSDNCMSGGFVGHRNGGGMLTMIHCLFDGELQGTGSSQWGGFVGYHNSGSQTFTTFTNCLFKPKAVNIGGSNSGTFITIHSSYVENVTFNNCYYTTALNTVQGKDASTMSDALLAATLGGWSDDVHPVTGDSNLGTTLVTDVPYYYLDDGAVHQPKPTLTDIKGNVLTEGTDYTLTWSGDGTTAATYTVTATALGTYTGKATATYTVTEGVPVTASTTLFEDTYVYKVYDDVTINDRITVLGEVILVLGEGTTLTAKKGITVGEGTKLTIQGSGTLTATGVNEYSGIGSYYSYWDMPSTGTIIINSGTINATGGSGDAAGIGGSQYSAAGTITINGGIVTATGGGVGSAIGGGGSPYNSSTPGAGGTITINGGQVTATSANGYGIGKGKNAKGEEYDGAAGTITLGWTDLDNDFILASSFAGNVTLAKTFFYEDGETGVTLDNLAAHAGEKLIPSTVATEKNLAYATIIGVADNYLYTGEAITIAPTVKDVLGNPLTEGSDYDVTIALDGPPVETVLPQGDYTLTLTPSTGSAYTDALTIGFTVTDFLEADGTDYFVNMPTTGAKQASLVAHNLAKVYDDGGKSSNFSRYCDGTLMLLAPAGYSIRLSGTIDLSGADYLRRRDDRGRCARHVQHRRHGECIQHQQ